MLSPVAGLTCAVVEPWYRRDIAVFLRRPAMSRFHRVTGMGLIQRIQPTVPGTADRTGSSPAVTED